MKIFAERLKDLRTEEKLSTRELAKIVGVTNTAICHWEREERVPSLENAAELAKYFKVSIDYLAGLED